MNMIKNVLFMKKMADLQLNYSLTVKDVLFLSYKFNTKLRTLPLH